MTNNDLTNVSTEDLLVEAFNRMGFIASFEADGCEQFLILTRTDEFGVKRVIITHQNVGAKCMAYDIDVEGA